MISPMEKREVIQGFSLENASQLTGLSIGQLRYWDRSGFFVPSLVQENRRLANSRIYTFRDLLALQVLKSLRMDLGVSLQHLREVKDRLCLMSDNEWNERRLFVLNRRVVFDDAAGQRQEVVSGQFVFDIPLAVVRRNMQDAVELLSKRHQGQIGHSNQSRGVAHNRKVFARTRIPIDAVRAFIDEGYSDRQILDEYPGLKPSDIRMVRQLDPQAA